MMKLKNIFLPLCIITASVVFITGCKPDEYLPEKDFSSFLVSNATPGSPTVDVLVDGKVVSSARLAYNTTTISQTGAGTLYIPVLAGQHTIALSRDTGKTASIADFTGNFETGKIYSYFMYDTVVSGKAKLLRLTDDLALPAAGMVNVRFLNLAPNAGAVDVTFVRVTSFDDTTTVRPAGVRTYVATDSFTISNKPYAGNNPDADALTRFSSITAPTSAAIVKALGFASVPAGNKNNRYLVKVKAAGTQTVLKQVNDVNLVAGRIYTLFLRGTAQGQALDVTITTNL
jgi:hypothetical protein